MNDVLKTDMIRYYDFMTAYQNLLRDKDTEAEISVSLNCTDAARNLSLNAWPPQKSSITVYAKNVNGRQVIHLQRHVGHQTRFGHCSVQIPPA